MRLYRRSKKMDLRDTTNLVHWDADHGRTHSALERLRDFELEIGGDATLTYSEGLLYRDFLGQGRRGYECFVRALELNGSYANAACNAAALAPSEQEFRRWVSLVDRLSPKDAANFELLREELAASSNYQYLLLKQSGQHFSDQDYGTAAALQELALHAGPFDPQEEVQIRRLRAQNLRFLDKQAEDARAMSCEGFPADERLCLYEALLELDRAIAIDGYDAELWNLRSAWCILLGRNSEAVDATDRAIALRPSGYPKPYINKSVALHKLNQNDAARTAAAHAKEECLALGALDDVRLAEQAMAAADGPGDALSESQAFSTVGRILQGTMLRARQMAGFMKVDTAKLSSMYAIRIRFIPQGSSLDCVSAVADLLSNFPVDGAMYVLSKLRYQGHPLWESLFEALCYIACNAEPVMREDAGRTLALLICDAPSIGSMRSAYRTRIAAPSLASPAEFGTLANVVADAMRRLNPQVADLIVNDIEPTKEELATVRAGMLSRLNGTPFINDTANYPSNRAVVAAFWGGVFVVAVLVGLGIRYWID